MGTSLRELIANAEKHGVSLKQLRGYGDKERSKGTDMLKAIANVKKAYPAYSPPGLTPETIDEFYKATGADKGV